LIIRNALRIAVVLFLLFPFLFLVASFRGSASVDWPELFWAFKNSFLQASLSAFFSVILGLWAALGLVRLKGRNLKPLTALAYFLCLLPNFLPAIFMLLAVLNAIVINGVIKARKKSKEIAIENTQE
jgi:thiamine transport system permease protein